APYLMGVRCGPEEKSRASRRTILTGSPALADAPAAAAEAASLLAVHGLLPRSALGADGLSEPVQDAEARRWMDDVALACGLGESAEGLGPGGSRRSAGSGGSPGARGFAGSEGAIGSAGSD